MIGDCLLPTEDARYNYGHIGNKGHSRYSINPFYFFQKRDELIKSVFLDIRQSMIVFDQLLDRSF